MRVLEFLGRDAESEALLFADADGVQYAAPLSDSLTDAVLRGVTTEMAEAPAKPLTPREIQALLREGVSAEQIAEQTGTDIERVRRFEGPVNAEIQRAISRVRNSKVGSEMGAPSLGDLVIDRLAQRGVNTDEITWRAARRSDGQWEVSAVFVENSVEQTASWTLSEPANIAIAKDKNASALTEVTRVAEPVRALFPPVSSAGHGTEVRRSVEDTHDTQLLERQEELLNRLNSQRGKRQPLVMDFDEEELTVAEPAEDADEDVPATLASVSVPIPVERTHRPRPNSQNARSSEATPEKEAPSLDPESDSTLMQSGTPAAATTVQELDVEIETTVLAPPASDSSRKRRRTPVPSWDEIVFGARND